MELNPQCPVDSKASKSEHASENAACESDASLPKLSPQEFRQWNHMADHMNLFVRAAPCTQLLQGWLSY